MNISRIDGSIYGAALFSQSTPAASSISRFRAVRARNGYPRSVVDGLYPIARHSHPTQPAWQCPNASSLSRTFCAAVAPAAGRPVSSNYFTSYPTSVRNWNHTAVPTAEPSEKTRKPQAAIFQRHVRLQPKDEVLSMVDYYDEDTADEYLKYYRDPYLRKYAASDGPKVTVSNKLQDLELQIMEGDREFSEGESEPVRNLRLMLASRHRHPGQVSLDTIWELYQALPKPQMAYMTLPTRYALMAALASAERKDQKSMLRYFAVVSDVKNAGFSLTTFQWNTALSFATRYVATTTVVEVEAALKLWREMEMEAGVRGNEVTFNILFDAASKAGKFSLAEMIYEEMMQRGYSFNRYHFVSLIHFFGLKRDSSGVRAAYKEMIEAGEIIDTVVLNCLIASFIRCGEEPSAEHVYEKMKAYNKDLLTIPHRDYSMAKAITKVLAMFARVSKKHPSMRPQFQRSALLSPDLGTYRILINHYGLRLGNISKVAQFLDEMKAFKVSLNGVIFLALFQSFAIHGGSGSDWSAQRLDSVWDAFLNAIDSQADGLYISTWLAMAVLKAYSRYTNRDELLGIYDNLYSRWELDEVDSQYMLHFLQKLLKSDNLFITKSQPLSTAR